MPRQKEVPALTLHRPSGRARVRIDGRDHYLGPYGSVQAREAYEEFIGEWLARQDVTRFALTVDELALAYSAHADDYYRHSDGTPTREAENIRIALRTIIRLYGRTRVREFGPKDLKAVRNELIRAGSTRSYINGVVGKIKRMFKWGVAEEMVPESVWRALQAVEGLRAGRTAARESPPIRPVDDAAVEATLPHLSPVVADMVRIQLLTGARPGEICSMRPCDVSRGSDSVWTYQPSTHKTEHHGKQRRIFIGPQSQRILARYLLRSPESYCFSPAEAETKRNEIRRAARRTPMTPSQAARKPKGRTLQSRFTKDAYNRSVQRACEAAFGMPPELRDIGRTVARMKDVTEADRLQERQRLSKQASVWRATHCWSPNQLRHNRATMLRSTFGLEAAQVVLGHSDPKTTLIYAEAQFGKAAEIARQIG